MGAAILDYLSKVAAQPPVLEALGVAVVTAAFGLVVYVGRGVVAAVSRWLESRRARRAIFNRFLAEVEIVEKMMGDSVKSSSLTTLEGEIDAHAALGKPFRVFVVLVTDDDAQREMETILALFDRATIRKVQEFLLLSRYFEESLRRLDSDAFAALRPTRQKTTVEQHFAAGNALGEAARDLALTLARHPWAERALRPPPNPGCRCLSREWGRNGNHGAVSGGDAAPKPVGAAMN